LGLPKLDGYEVIRLLKARPALEGTVLVIPSRRDGVLDHLKGRLIGAHAYLTKPFKTQQILSVVQAHLGTHDGSQALYPASMRSVKYHEASSSARASIWPRSRTLFSSRHQSIKRITIF
jgi:DNA-binding response OmpR family regulator